MLVLLTELFDMQLKRKPDAEDVDAAVSNEWTNSPGFVEGVASPLQTPISGKGGRICSKPNHLKYNKSGFATPIPNAGEKLWSTFYSNFTSFRCENIVYLKVVLLL